MGVGSGSAGRFDIPHDADDFSRCYDLVTFAEVSPAYDLPRICEIFPWYKPIIDSWETLIEPSYWRLHLSTMVHDVVAAVFDEMTGLGFNPKK